MRGIIRELGTLRPTDGPDVTVVDMEAGLEGLKRGTPAHTDAMLAVAEPYYRSLETATRTAEMGLELGIPKVGIVANKVRDERDEEWIRQVFEPRGLELYGVVPYDDAVLVADRTPAALIDVDAASPAVKAVESLVDRLVELEAPASRSG